MLVDDRVWYRVNRVAGVAVVFASGVYGAVAVTWPYDRSAGDNFATRGVHLAAFVVPLVIGLGVAVRNARAH